MPMRSTDITARFSEATEYAREAHAGQVRKTTRIPYISHPIAVASLVLTYGGDEEQAIAALLHDVLEDCGAHHEAIIRDRFGDRVARMVLDCTDGTAEAKAVADTPEARREDWQRRKIAYLEALQHKPSDTLLVSACDKLHNARCIVDDLEDPATGIAVFDRFNAGRVGTVWYYNELARAFEHCGSPVASALGIAVAKIAAAGAEPMNLPDSFPPGTEFAEFDDIPLSRDADWNVLAWDGPEPRRFRSTGFSSGRLISEPEFRGLVASLQAEPKAHP